METSLILSFISFRAWDTHIETFCTFNFLLSDQPDPLIFSGPPSFVQALVIWPHYLPLGGIECTVNRTNQKKYDYSKLNKENVREKKSNKKITAFRRREKALTRHMKSTKTTSPPKPEIKITRVEAFWPLVLLASLVFFQYPRAIISLFLISLFRIYIYIYCICICICMYWSALVLRWWNSTPKELLTDVSLVLYLPSGSSGKFGQTKGKSYHKWQHLWLLAHPIKFGQFYKNSVFGRFNEHTPQS